MRRFLILFFVGWTTFAYNQQMDHFTQYAFNQFTYNPAVAGTKSCIDIRTGYRFQWAGIDGAPQTGFINAHAPLHFGKKKRSAFGPKHGIGGQIKRDAFGPYSNLGLQVAYALHLPLSRKWNLSFGASIGFKQTSFRASYLTTELNDPTVPSADQSFVLFPDGVAGLWISDKKTYFGLSVHQLFGNKMPKIGPDAKLQRHVYITGGHSFSLEKRWSLIPSFFFMWTKNTPIDFHLSALTSIINFHLELD